MLVENMTLSAIFIILLLPSWCWSQEFDEEICVIRCPRIDDILHWIQANTAPAYIKSTLLEFVETKRCTTTIGESGFLCPTDEESICGMEQLTSQQRIAGTLIAAGDSHHARDEVGSHPWMTSYGHREVMGNKSTKWIHSCGGTIINRNTILTAAHCYNGHKYWIRAGDTDLSFTFGDSIEWKVIDVLVHEEARSKQAYFDVALMKTEFFMRYTAHILPICLPNPDRKFRSDEYDGKQLQLTGWGWPQKNSHPDAQVTYLKRYDLRVYNQGYCNNTFYEATCGETNYILARHSLVPHLFDDTLICAGNHLGGSGSCSGDSGGPLSWFEADPDRLRTIQIGIVSGGIANCRNPCFPDVYVRVDHPEILEFVLTGIGKGRKNDKVETATNSTDATDINATLEDQPPNALENPETTDVSNPNTVTEKHDTTTPRIPADLEKVNHELFAAASQGNRDAVKSALDRGASINSMEESEMEGRFGTWKVTPLMKASEQGHCDIVQLLIERGADINARGGTGKTALMWAAESGQTHCVKILLDSHADIEVQEALYKRRALHYAALEGHLEIVKQLVEAGAELSPKHAGDLTPLGGAEDYGELAVAQYLRSKGATT